MPIVFVISNQPIIPVSGRIPAPKAESPEKRLGHNRITLRRSTKLDAPRIGIQTIEPYRSARIERFAELAGRDGPSRRNFFLTGDLPQPT